MAWGSKGLLPHDLVAYTTLSLQHKEAYSRLKTDKGKPKDKPPHSNTHINKSPNYALQPPKKKLSNS